MEGVISEEFVEIGQPSFFIGVFFFRFEEQALRANKFLVFGVGEEAFKIGVAERVVVGEGDFVEVVGIDELLFRGVALPAVPASHD